MLAALTWIMPGLNALCLPYRRPDLFQLTGRTGKVLGLPKLVWCGILWPLFILPVYASALLWPLIQGVRSGGTAYLGLANPSGIGMALVFVGVGIAIYIVMRLVNKARGIDVTLMFQELPPD